MKLEAPTIPLAVSWGSSLNLQMPNLKGLKVITPMRSDAAITRIPIVAITDLALPEEAEKYIVVGASKYISRTVQLKKSADIVHICRRHDRELI